MGFASRRLKRKRLVPRSGDRSGDRSDDRSDDPSNDFAPSQGIPIIRVLRSIGFLVFYIVWSSFTFPRSSGWRADLRIAIEKQLGWKPSLAKENTKPASVFQDAETLFEDDVDGSATPGLAITERYQQHRIPCGLIVIDNDTESSSFGEGEDDVLPLDTSAIVPKYTTIAESSATNSYAPSTLHARALVKYPRLQRHVVVVPSSSSNVDEAVGKQPFKRMIPGGIFRLRMGSEESTIDDSPPLFIVEEETSESENENESDTMNIDLVLGAAFWKGHQAELGSDEVYLYPTQLSSSKTNSEEKKGSRVMVPFLRMRSRPSFGTDDL